MSYFEYNAYKLSYNLSPYIHTTLKLSPNNVTTIKLIFSIIFFILCLYNYYNRKLSISIMCLISWYITFLCDYLDGTIARRYNLTSEFGYYYDHICDYILLLILILLNILYRFNKNITIFVTIIYIICGYYTEIKQKDHNKKILFYMKYFDMGMLLFLYIPIIMSYHVLDDIY